MKVELRCMNVIDKSVDQANNIIADLLDYSREIHLDLGEYSPKSRNRLRFAFSEGSRFG